jgi:hypothetical protein
MKFWCRRECLRLLIGDRRGGGALAFRAFQCYMRFETATALAQEERAA